MANNQRGRYVFANPLHWRLFRLFFLTAAIPTLIIALSEYYLIYHVIREHITIESGVETTQLLLASQQALKVIMLVTPLAMLMILVFAYRLTHRIVGPFDRLVRELKETADKERTGALHLRDGDLLKPMIDQVNRIIAPANQEINH